VKLRLNDLKAAPGGCDAMDALDLWPAASVVKKPLLPRAQLRLPRIDGCSAGACRRVVA
jgi:hypothetical protein